MRGDEERAGERDPWSAMRRFQSLLGLCVALLAIADAFAFTSPSPVRLAGGPLQQSAIHGQGGRVGAFSLQAPRVTLSRGYILASLPFFCRSILIR